MSSLHRPSLPKLDRGHSQQPEMILWILLSCVVLVALWSPGTLSSEVSLAAILISALLSSIAGFAFSPLAGSILFHLVPDPVLVIKILLIASIAQQVFCTWWLRSLVNVGELAPYLVGSLTTLPLGLLLLLRTHATIYLPVLGGLLIGYGAFVLAKPVIRSGSNPLLGRIAMGALGGLTGGVAAFPSAFVTIWCQAQGFSKERQRSIIQPFILVNQLWAFAALTFLHPVGAISVGLVKYVPPALLGAYIGLRLFESLSTAGFNRVVALFLVFSGIVMAAKPF